MPPRLLSILAGCALLLAPASAPAETVRVTKVLGEASVKPGTVLAPGSGIRTAARSKSELALESGTVRTGANAEVQSLPHGLALRQGVTLVAARPGTFRQTIEVRAQGYRLKVRGTAQVAYQPGGSMKVVVLEGTVTVALDSLAGEAESLKPGQMLVINPSDRRLPEPVEVDLQRLVSTSALVNGAFGPLATAGEIAAAGTGQTRDFAHGDLASTPLLLRGLENALLVERLEQARTSATVASRAVTPQQFERSVFSGVNDSIDPNVVSKQRIYLFANNQNATDTVDGMVFQRGRTRNQGRTHLLQIEMVPHYTILDPNSDDPTIIADRAPRVGGKVTVSPDFFSTGAKSLEFFTEDRAPGFESLQISPTALIYTPTGVGLRFETVAGLDAVGAGLRAGAGADAPLLLRATDGDLVVEQQSRLRGGSVALEGGTNLRIDHSSVVGTKQLRVGTAASGTSIQIQNSSQLAALVGNITVLSKRGPITIDTSSLLAGGAINVDGRGDSATGSSPGTVTLRGASLSAEAIRLRAFASNGSDALVIDGSSFKASQLVQLYADGASTLHFKNQVTLSTPLAILAGQTVLVDPGSLVRVTGQARIYTDHADFNQGGYGDIRSKGGPVTAGYGSRPNR